jgi:hypothetical protein
MNSGAAPEAGALTRFIRRVRRLLGARELDREYRAPVLFFVARQHGLAYLQVPKAACTSLRAAICLLNHPELDPAQVTRDEWIHQNREMNDILRPGAPELAQLFRFTFVRHPYARFVSFYRNKIAEPDSPAVAKALRKAGLQRRDVDRCRPRRHRGHIGPATRPSPIPQVDLVYRGGASLVEFIGRVERLAEDLNVVENRAGISLNLPHLNRAAGGGVERAREVLAEAARVRLQRIYQRDFERFAYEP